MRVVVDTNVVVSGFFFGGVPGRILTAVGRDEISMVLSPKIIDEYQRIGRELAGAHPARRDGFEAFVAAVATNAIIVDAPTLPEPVSVDPADDMFLAAAVASHAGIVISGDRHLLDVTNWRGVEVLTPRQFNDRYLRA